MSGPESDHQQRRLSWILPGSAWVLCAIQVVVLVPNHDNAWLLEIAARMLNGGKYYRDFYELNPPLYPILLWPVNLLSRASGIAPYTVFILWVCALLYFAARQFLACLPVIAPDSTPATRLLLALYAQACLFLLPGYDFGQRDHVAICLLIPLLCYFITEQSAGSRPRQAVLAAVCAALGLMIKPFLAGVVLLILAVRVAVTRQARDLLWVIVLPGVAVAAGYVVLVATVFPEYIRMAHIAGDAYSMYASHRLLPQWSVPALLLTIAAALANEYIPSSARRGVRYLVAATAGALLSDVLQHKGFTYHLVPVQIMLGLTLAPIATALLQRRASSLAWAPHALLAVLALAVCTEEARSLHGPEKTPLYYGRFAARLAELNAGHRLFFFSTSLEPEFPFNLYYDFTPSSRFPCLWTLPAALARSGAAGSQREARELISLVEEDFRRWQPTALLVDVSPNKQALAQPFEFLPWFQQDPGMRRLLDQYQLAGTSSNGLRDDRRFAIYVRKASAAVPAASAALARN